MCPPPTPSSHVEKAILEGERVRFVGRHSKDNNLSIYLQKRNIIEIGGGEGVEPLGCIVRINKETASDLGRTGQVVVIGVLSRLVCDFGLQYTEHSLYQQETVLYPSSTINGRGKHVIFDVNTKFVTNLPDEWHFPFLIKLPSSLPPSVMMKGSGGIPGGVSWGLSWYVFAYIGSQNAVQNTLTRHGIDGTWPRLRMGRRHSKVFLSFGKFNKGDGPSIDRLLSTIPSSTGTSRRRSLLGGGLNGGSGPLTLEATLDKSAYCNGDGMNVYIKLRNPGRQRAQGIRITVKQLVNFKYGSDPRQTIKSTIAEYNVTELSPSSLTAFDTVYEMNPLCDADKINGYQLALEHYLPRREDLLPSLSPSFAFTGPEWSRQYASAYGLEKLRLFSIEYYVNVHVVIPWSSDVIVKLPFKVVSKVTTFDQSSSTQAFNRITATNTAPPPYSSSSSFFLNEKRTALSTGQPLRGNLISFDFDEADGGRDDMELDDEPATILPSIANTTTTQSSSFTDHVNGVTFLDDVVAARSVIEAECVKLRNNHKNAISLGLDRKTLLMQFENRRISLNISFLDSINLLLTQDLPRLKSALSLSDSAKKETRFYAAQATASRLMSTANSQASLIPLTFTRDSMESRFEAMMQIIDDFELFLVRAQKGNGIFDTEQLLDRISYQLLSIVPDLATGYDTIQRDIQLLYDTIISLKLAYISSRKFAREDEEEEENHQDFSEVVVEEGVEDLLAAMAQQFPQIYSFKDELEISQFPSQFTLYVARLVALISSDLPLEKLASVAYFHWRFLIALIKKYFLGEQGEHLSRLLFPDIDSGSLRWSSLVESSIPARFILQSLSPDSEYEETANQLIASMQRLL